MVLDYFRNTWEELSGLKTDEQHYVLSKIIREGVHLGIDSYKGSRLLVIELDHENSRNILITAPAWKGIKFSAFPFQNNRGGFFLELTIDGFSDIFEAISLDIVTGLENSEKSERYEIVRSVIDKWKMFFDRNNDGRLSLSQQKGLFGELCGLHTICDKIGSIDSLKAWEGPLKKLHDFKCKGGNLEIKSTAFNSPLKVRITNEKQLDSGGRDLLFLAVYVLQESENKGKTLKGFIRELRERFSENPIAAQLFEDLLVMSGYHDSNDMHYDIKRYLVMDPVFFEIKEEFPKITDVPEGIFDVKYTLDLSGCSEFKTAPEMVWNKLLN
ncbi:PD-(D/E)XK motif protein [Robertkochia aurantiaca]|uniref:PD-(D/E)XK motif protein n=1 Tax=Robertkochia aurantiaca TaxID=2873700 RepID=UPI001CCA123E|nr:PD-(D/E)XK motif protein [Robertkochia sp. 3YJGBD-33]